MAVERILVATDMSERSDRAIARACLLARQQHAALRLLHVVDEELPAPIAEAQLASAEAALRRLVSSGGGFEGLDAEIRAIPGDPWRTIVQQADQIAADLLVLGGARQRGIADMFEGTTLQRVARVARRPVLRVAAPAHSAYGQAVVGVDFSECAKRAARLALELAPTAAVSFVHAYHVPYRALTAHTGPLGDLTKAEKDAIEDDLARQMTEFVSQTVPPGREVSTGLAEGAPEHVLVQAIATRNADLVSLGLHARSWLQEALLGSTARRMLAECPCDLLLAPLPG